MLVIIMVVVILIIFGILLWLYMEVSLMVDWVYGLRKDVAGILEIINAEQKETNSLQSIRNLLVFIKENFKFNIKENEKDSYIRMPIESTKVFFDLIEEAEKNLNAPIKITSVDENGERKQSINRQPYEQHNKA